MKISTGLVVVVVVCGCGGKTPRVYRRHDMVWCGGCYLLLVYLPSSVPSIYVIWCTSAEIIYQDKKDGGGMEGGDHMHGLTFRHFHN